jgi:hypothetical protein
VRYIADIENLSGDPTIVDVVLYGVTGRADYVAEVYGKAVLDLPDDTVGIHLACATGQAVVVARSTPNPYDWQLLCPDGRILDIDLDIEKLDDESVVNYKEAEPASGANPVPLRSTG